MGRTGRPRLAIGAGTIAVLLAAISVILTRGGTPVAHAATTLMAVRDSYVVHPDGSTSAARDGQRLGSGDVVRTRADGRAELVTRGRVVYLAGAAAVAVVDGAHQQLRTGATVIDAQHGPGMRLDVADDTVSIPAGSATEVDRSVAVRVGSLAGASRVTSSSGRQLPIAALYQAVISGDALPLQQQTTPLQLTDNTGEAQAAPTLVGDDVALNTLAKGIDTTRRAVAKVVAAAWNGPTTTLPAGTARSERVLPMLIAASTPASQGPRQQRYDHAVTWRSKGGSWGVVDHLLTGRASGALARFTAYEHQHLGRSSRAGATPAQIVAAAAAGAPGTGQRPGGSGPGPGPGRSTGPGSNGSHHHHQPAGSGTGGSPPSGPQPPTGPVGVLVTATGHALAGVLALLPLNAIISALTKVPVPGGHAHSTGLRAGSAAPGSATTGSAATIGSAATAGAAAHRDPAGISAPGRSHRASIGHGRTDQPASADRHRDRRAAPGRNSAGPTSPPKPPTLLATLLGALFGG